MKNLRKEFRLWRIRRLKARIDKLNNKRDWLLLLVRAESCESSNIIRL